MIRTKVCKSQASFLNWVVVTIFLNILISTTIITVTTEARALKFENPKYQHKHFEDNYYNVDSDEDYQTANESEIKEIQSSEDPTVSISIQISKNRKKAGCKNDQKRKELTQVETELIDKMKEIQDYFSKFKSSDKSYADSSRSRVMLVNKVACEVGKRWIGGACKKPRSAAKNPTRHHHHRNQN